MRDIILVIGLLLVLIGLMFLCLFGVFGGKPEGVYWRQGKLERKVDTLLKQNLDERLKKTDTKLDAFILEIAKQPKWHR